MFLMLNIGLSVYLLLSDFRGDDDDDGTLYFLTLKQALPSFWGRALEREK